MVWAKKIPNLLGYCFSPYLSCSYNIYFFSYYKDLLSRKGRVLNVGIHFPSTILGLNAMQGVIFLSQFFASNIVLISAQHFFCVGFTFQSMNLASWSMRAEDRQMTDKHTYTSVHIHTHTHASIFNTHILLTNQDGLGENEGRWWLRSVGPVRYETGR